MAGCCSSMRYPGCQWKCKSSFCAALEERAFRRVGGTNLIHVDVQILAASNRNLITLMKMDNSVRIYTTA